MHIETDTIEIADKYPGEFAAARFEYATGNEALSIAEEIGADLYVRHCFGLTVTPIAKVRRRIARGALPLSLVLLPVSFRFDAPKVRP